VYGAARVYGDAWVSGDARVYGDAWVYGAAQVSGDAQVYGDAWVSGDAKIERSPVCITWGGFTLTAYSDLVQIGCKLHTQDKWAAIFADGIYRELAGGAKAYAAYRTMFETAVKMLGVEDRT
jgi:hypothetical protein